MTRQRHPVTPALRVLRAAGVSYLPHTYRYEERGGTGVASRELGIDEHICIKTLVFEDDAERPFVVLMHGDREVSTRMLARAMEARSVRPCEPDVAQRHSGYRVGGTSPFGMRKVLPTYIQRTIADLPRVFVNGGRRGFLLEMAAADMQRALRAVLVDVAIDPADRGLP